MTNRKDELRSQLRILVRESRMCISDEDALKMAKKLPKYNQIKKELDTIKNVIYAPKRLIFDNIIYKILEMAEEMDMYDWAYLEKEDQLKHINKIMRKLRVIKMLLE